MQDELWTPKCSRSFIHVSFFRPSFHWFWSVANTKRMCERSLCKASLPRALRTAGGVAVAAESSMPNGGTQQSRAGWHREAGDIAVRSMSSAPGWPATAEQLCKPLAQCAEASWNRTAGCSGDLLSGMKRRTCRSCAGGNGLVVRAALRSC